MCLPLAWRYRSASVSVFGRHLGLCTLVFGVLLTAVESAWSDDLTVIRRRMEADWLEVPSADSVRELMSSMRPDGSWTDIDYANRSRSAWQVPGHLSRVMELARAFRTRSEQPALQRKTLEHALRGLDCWLQKDPQNPNWWWNEIGVPRSLARILLLMQDELSKLQRAGGLKILRRAKIGMTGQNLVWVAEITAARGLLENDAELVDRAFRRIAQEIRVSSGEGIQADFSFHQHGPCLYSHGYGAGFIVDCARIASLVRGTGMEFPAAKVKLLSHLILDGTAWMVRGGATDFGAEGREITRQGQSASHVSTAARHMLELSTERNAEFRELARRTDGHPDAQPLIGNRAFWCSDFMTHHRPAYYASARMHSTRLANTDGPANSEGLLSHHLADGCFVLMQDGSEYDGIFGVWDWQRIPGTTVALKPQLIGSPRRMGSTQFVGAVSDGQYGMAVQDFVRDALSARTSWFFFDDEVVCLGAGIDCDSDHPVVTTINQCLLRGEVVCQVDGERRTLTPGSHRLRNVEFIWHDHVAYLPIRPASLGVQHGPVTGSWHAANRRYPDRPQSKDLFMAEIEHGTRPQAASYAYAVIPAVPRDAVLQRLERRDWRVVSNMSRLQVVEHEQLQLVAAACYEAAEVAVDENRGFQVDRPCLLLIRDTQHGVHVTAADPSRRASRVRVQLRWPSPSSRKLVAELQMPEGLRAGSSVTWTEARTDQ